MCVNHNRFIPTHVGNAPKINELITINPVHPHTCRERPAARWVVDLVPRFIPTHVGNAELPTRDDGETPVHPHTCRERTSTTPPTTVTAGSSPHM